MVGFFRQRCLKPPKEIATSVRPCAADAAPAQGHTLACADAARTSVVASPAPATRGSTAVEDSTARTACIPSTVGAVSPGTSATTVDVDTTTRGREESRTSHVSCVRAERSVVDGQRLSTAVLQ